MYNKKFYFEKIEQFSGRHPWGGSNPAYDGMEGRICYPAYLNVGERGWILYEREDEPSCYPHRLHTSIIQDVKYSAYRIIVTTENTRLTLKVHERQGTDE